MKKVMFSVFLMLFAALWTGCDRHNNFIESYPVYEIPSPTNLIVYSGDSEVDLYWDPSPERNIAGYNVYYSYDLNGKYYILGHTKNTYYIDGGANGPQNGVVYYYAVSAYDYDGNESPLTTSYSYAIPRPEGYNVSIFDFRTVPATAGYDLSQYKVLPYNDKNTDFFFEKYNGKYYLDIYTDTDIKDMGSTTDITDILLAPVSGYVSLVPGDSIKYAEAKVGHTYVIRTWDDHYGKVRISQISADSTKFDWAYQLDKNERLLKQSLLNSKNRVISGVVVKHN